MLLLLAGCVVLCACVVVLKVVERTTLPLFYPCVHLPFRLSSTQSRTSTALLRPVSTNRTPSIPKRTPPANRRAATSRTDAIEHGAEIGGRRCFVFLFPLSKLLVRRRSFECANVDRDGTKGDRRKEGGRAEKGNRERGRGGLTANSIRPWPLCRTGSKHQTSLI